MLKASSLYPAQSKLVLLRLGTKPSFALTSGSEVVNRMGIQVEPEAEVWILLHQKYNATICYMSRS